jgi:antitoxin component YwqK of YwqJK toxin-antitoxin module
MRAFRLLLLLVLSTLLGSCAGSRFATAPPAWAFWKNNRFDRHGLETGRWRTYYDDGHHRPYTAGRYRHGRPVKTFQYYTPEGKLDRTETYSKDGYCEVSYWHPGGQLARRGPAQWVTGPGKAPRFYWYGTWTSYEPDGQISAVQTYVDGNITRAETYEKGQLIEVELFENNKRSRVETYANGQLLKVETFEKGLRVGTTSTL